MGYIVTSLGPVTHNGAVFEQGREIPGLSPEQAVRLLALGVIQEAVPPPLQDKPPVK